MNIDKDNAIEIINFLKENDDLNEELVEVIESCENGVYFINEQSIKFSNQAKKLLDVNDEVSLNFFYQQINIQDRKKFIQLLNEKQENNSPYEMIYRYKVHDQLIWIKEHGIFSYKNKNKRLALISNITNQIEQEKKLHRLAFYDSITQLKNRNYFDKDMQFFMNYHVPFSFFLMDLNSFKVINDNFGHLFGDYILKEFSKRIKCELESIYEFDIYRLSGDEFAMIFPYLNKIKETDIVIRKIFDLLEEPFTHEDFQISITPSIGITFYPKDSKNHLTLLKYADISMYRAKNDSLLSYSYFDKDYYKSLLNEKKIENYLENIIKKDLIKLKYQPIYDITNMKIISMEALFYDEVFSLDKLFNIALKSNLIILLEKKILEKVIKDINVYQKVIPENIRFTINLTPKTTEYLDVYGEIIQLMKKYNISGHRIGIEITEQYFIKDECNLNLLIDKLHAQGIKIYLDDFGMGFSSVRNLTYLNYDHIKIDKRMISSVFENKKSQLFIKSIIQFSQDIGSNVIVEGVETKEQLNYLQQLGVVYIQGFYLSKPQDIKEIISQLTYLMENNQEKNS